MQKDELINILGTWNYWNNEIEDFKNRLEYEKKIQLLKETREVIVLKGIRRSGKSTLLNLEIKNLQKTINKENILFINFEEPRFMNHLNIQFLDFLFETYLEYLEPKGKIFIFLDEIQNLKGFEKWILRMYEKKDIQIYVTGSSSKLLSSEFSTALSGRHIGIEVFPLSFLEYLNFNNIKLITKKDIALKKIELKKYFNTFFKWGGFPKISLIKNEINKKSELLSYYDSIILKDTAQRHNISNIDDLKKISFYLLTNVTKFYSLNNLNKLGFGSYDTIKKYIEILKESYLIFDLSLYNTSIKKQLVNPNKIYCIDNGLINAVSFRFSDDKGRLLENLVFIELKKRFDEIYYHKEKKECDFLIKDKTKIIKVIQVAYSIDDIQTRKREIEGLIDAMKTHKLTEGLIITMDEEGEEIIDNFKVIIKPIYKWLIEL